MNFQLFVGILPTLPAGAVVAALLSLLPCLLPGISIALAADPSDPATPVPAVTYRSAFEPYERWRDGPKLPWRDSNDTVGRMGGHMGHVEETAPPQAPAGSQPTDGQPPAPGGGQHQQHKP